MVSPFKYKMLTYIQLLFVVAKMESKVDANQQGNTLEYIQTIEHYTAIKSKIFKLCYFNWRLLLFRQLEQEEHSLMRAAPD